ncbi:hypothetical protein [Paremcibacter congregatus]|uniref:hypothetical protein n=1 Tax=Paremcibacter congregatus TaxID=2043170 RepID=UPI003A94D1D6
MITRLLFARETKLDFKLLWLAFWISEAVITNGYETARYHYLLAKVRNPPVCFSAFELIRELRHAS